MVRNLHSCRFVLRMTRIGLFFCLAGATATANAYSLKETDSGAQVRWHRDQVTLQVVRVDPGTLSSAQVVRFFERAADRWSAVPGAPRIEVTSGEATSEWGYDGVNGVYVLAEWPFPDQRLGVTISTYSSVTGALIDTDVLLNGSMDLGAVGEGSATARSFDLDTLVTHEVGHVLGLDESERHEATMWPSHRRGEMERRELSPDDVDAVIALYAAESTAGATAGALGCSVRPSGARTTLPAASLALAFALMLRRRAR